MNSSLCFPPFLQRVITHDLCLQPWVIKNSSKTGSTLNGKNLLLSKFFPLRIDAIEKEGKKATGKIASPESVPICPKR